MIKLPYQIGFKIREQIDKYRMENKIPMPEELRSVRNLNDTFLETELELIKELKIDKEMIPYLDKFPNVESVILDGFDQVNENDIKTIFSKFPNLKKFAMYYQDNIEVLDLSLLGNLETLEIVSNYELKEIKGLEKLTKLSNFTFYDNQAFSNINEVCQIIKSPKIEEVKLDVLYFYESLEQLAKKEDFDIQNIKWCEAIDGGLNIESIEYNIETIREAYKKAEQIINTYIDKNDSNQVKYALIHMWMCENVSYDFDALNNKHTNQKSKILGGANGTVDALTIGNCVCQGYTKAMQLLLKLVGIKAYDAPCTTDDKKIYVYDGTNRHLGKHSILRVELDGENFYSDVTWDSQYINAGLEATYFLMSKEDFSKTHNLRYETKTIAPRTIDKKTYSELIEIAKKRLKERKMVEPQTIKNTLCSINKELIVLNRDYLRVIARIENRYTNGIVNNIESDLKVRDQISAKINSLIKYKESLYTSLGYYMGENEQVYLSEIENLLGIKITSKRPTIDPKKFNGVPYLEYKTEEELVQEYQDILKRLNKLLKDKVIDVEPIVEAKLRSVLKNKYESMINEVKKQALIQAKQVSAEKYSEEKMIRKKELGEYQDKIQRWEEIRIKSGYYEMDEVEKKIFDDALNKIENQTNDVKADRKTVEQVEADRHRTWI